MVVEVKTSSKGLCGIVAEKITYSFEFSNRKNENNGF
jgi:hypothetical protein